MQLWASRHLGCSGLVALSIVDDEVVDPARGPVSMPHSVRVVDEATAELVQNMLGVAAEAAAAAGQDVRVDLDAVIARAEHLRQQP